MMFSKKNSLNIDISSIIPIEINQHFLFNCFDILIMISFSIYITLVIAKITIKCIKFKNIKEKNICLLQIVPI